MPRPQRVVIVGASLAGARAAEALRDYGFDGEVVLVGSEPHLPYDRPPLSKGFLAGSSGPREIGILDHHDVSRLGIEPHLGVAARRLDPLRATVELGDGERIRYDTLVIATGCSAWMPDAWSGLEGVHLLRTLDDGLALRAAMRSATSLAVVGGGFIGCEAAATGRALGLEVTIIEALEAPMARALGVKLASACAGYHADHGVKSLCGVSVEAVEGNGRVERIRLSDGQIVECDLVVVGIGVRPAVGWLEGSGLALADGVVCDDRCASSIAGIYAAGDVARWYNPIFDQEMRVEHWTNASEQGAFVGRSIAEGRSHQNSFGSVPFVWSEQYGIRIEIAGHPGAGDTVEIVEGSVADRRFVALYRRRQRFVGAVAFDSTRSLLAFRRLLARNATWEDALAQSRGAA